MLDPFSDPAELWDLTAATVYARILDPDDDLSDLLDVEDDFLVDEQPSDIVEFDEDDETWRNDAEGYSFDK